MSSFYSRPNKLGISDRNLDTVDPMSSCVVVASVALASLFSGALVTDLWSLS
jgi:hypothetical protein